MPATTNPLKSERSQVIGLPFEPLFLPDFNYFQSASMWPGLLYVFRRALRRGKGNWLDKYGVATGAGPNQRPTPRFVAQRLPQLVSSLAGFADRDGQEILADWLAAAALETVNGTADPDDPVIRAVPLHYFTSWIDLPQPFVHLRGLPELLAGALSQQHGSELAKSEKGPFGVKCDPEQNLLFHVFGTGWRMTDENDLTGDGYDEETPLDPDVLLAVRLGQSLGTSPEQVRGDKGRVPLYQPLCGDRLRRLREDLSVLLRAYGGSCPPAALMELLSATLVVNLTTYLLCHARTAIDLWTTGEVREARPEEVGLFVDVGDGDDPAARRMAQQAYNAHVDLLQRYVTVHLGFRWLGRFADPKTRLVRAKLPDPHTETVDHLAALVALREDPDIGPKFDSEARAHLRRLADAYEAAEESPGDEADALLKGETDRDARPFDVWIRVLSLIQPDLSDRLINNFYVGCTGANTPFGVMHPGNRKEPNHYVLSNPVVEALVHSQTVTRNSGLRERRPAVREFLRELREAYGLYVDGVPRSLDPTGGPRSLRDGNLRALKERLRLLGLFREVSDAEAMQRIRPRYPVQRAGGGG